MADSLCLFAASLISDAVKNGLPNGFIIRPLSRDDYGKGFYDCLRVLTWVGDPTESQFHEQFDRMAAAKDTYFFTVIEYHGRVVGTGCLVVEEKLYVDVSPSCAKLLASTSPDRLDSECNIYVFLSAV
jgi:glucosamine-phosphate N-acetyltransferase